MVAVVTALALATKTWAECLEEPFTVTCYHYTQDSPGGSGEGAQCVIETGRNVLVGEGDRELGKVVVDGGTFYDGFDYVLNSQLPYSVVIHANKNLEDGYMDYAAQHHDFNRGDPTPPCVKYPDWSYPEGTDRPAFKEAVACTFDSEC